MERHNIAFLGTGLMGRPMAHRLLQSGFSVWVYNRMPEKAQWLAEKGAVVCRTPADAVKEAPVVLTMLSDAEAIRSVLAQIPGEIMKGRTLVQMSTILPQESIEFSKKMHTLGANYVEAPVLGSIPEAQAGNLFVFVSGDVEHYRRLLSIFESFAKQVLYVGEMGKAATLKLAFNQLIASHMVAFSVSFGMLRRAGVDTDLFMRILRESALYAPTFDKKLPRVLERNFGNPNFPVRLMLKDVRLILKEVKARGMASASVEALEKLFADAASRSYADGDYSAVYQTIDPE